MKKHIDFNLKGNLLSIKDLNGTVDIKDLKWDFIFQNFMLKTCAIYFWGWSKNFDEGLMETIKYISEETLYDYPKHNVILLKIKDNNIVISRNHLSKIFQYYSNYALIFTDRILEEKMIRSITNGIFKTEQLDIIGLNYFVIFSGMEEDVLWMKKSNAFEWGSEINESVEDSKMYKLQNKLNNKTFLQQLNSFLKRNY